MTKTIANDIVRTMTPGRNAVDRLVLELFTKEFKYELNIAAAHAGVTMRSLVLMSIASYSSEMKEAVERELRKPTLPEAITQADQMQRDAMNKLLRIKKDETT